MSLKPKPLELDSDDPFKSDLLNRKPEIENLSLLLSNMNSPAVMAIDSKWGSGKTTFIKLWQHYLNSQETPSIYFNSWETDFSEDPLISFLGEMDIDLKNLMGKGTKINEAWTKTKSAGTQVAKRLIPATLKLGTMGVIDADEITESIVAETVGNISNDAIKIYTEQKQAISRFQKNLNKFVSELSSNKKLIIFVDELDRCRPSYAIELLERIKHLFNIEGIIFILALDKTQLSHSINAVYGKDMDSKGYLSRFIDFEYSIKPPHTSKLIESVISELKINDFLSARSVNEYLKEEHIEFKKAINVLFTPLILTPREIKKTLSHINISIRSTKDNEYIYPSLMIFLVLCKRYKNEVYKKYISNTHDETEAISYLYEVIPNKKEFLRANIEGQLISAKQDKISSETPKK